MSHTMALRATTRNILTSHRTFMWTTMGFGMIRTYLDNYKRWRLNVWDDRLRVSGVSDIHDHPWDFSSTIVAGQISNTRYAQHLDCDRSEATHLCHKIATGEGIDDRRRCLPFPCRLEAWPDVAYGPGEVYAQKRYEVHATRYIRGTVTLNDRSPPTPEYTARVYWPMGEEWVNAMPREATHSEITGAVDAAMELLK